MTRLFVFSFIFTGWLNVHCQNNNDSVLRNLELENSNGVSFYLKTLPASTSQSLFTIENFIVAGDYTSAQVELEKINISKLESCEKGRALMFSAVLLHKQLKYSEAINNLQNARIILRKCSDPSHYLAELDYWSGYILLEQNKFLPSEKSLRNALAYYKRDSLRYYIKEAKIYFWLGTVKLSQQNSDSSIYWLTRSLNIFENTPFDKTKEIVKIHNNLGGANTNLWNYKESILHYEKAVKINLKNNADPKDLTYACANLGLFYDKFENYLKSEYWYEQAFNWMKKNQLEPVKKINILQNYAGSLGSQGKFVQAVDVYLQSLQIVKPYQSELGDIYASILLNIANTYLTQEMYNETEKYSSLLRIFFSENEGKWPDQESLLKFLMARILINKKQFDEAMILINELETYYQNKKNDEELFTIIESKAICSQNLKKYKESQDLYKELLNYYNSRIPSTHPQIISIYNAIGSQFVEQANTDSSKFYLQLAKRKNALRKDSLVNIDLYSSKTEWLISNFYLLKLDLNNFKQDNSVAELRLDEGLIFSSLAVIDSKRTELSEAGDVMNLHRMTHDFFDVAMEYYFILYKETGNKEYVDKAFFISEKTKYQALHQSMKLDRVNAFAGVTNRVLQEESNLAKQMSQLEYQYSQELARQEEPLLELVEEYISGWKANSTRYDKLIDSIRNNLPNYYNLKFNKATVEINQIQTDLLSKNHNTAWVSYYFGAETCYAIVISSTEKHFINLGLSESIARLTKSFNNYVTHQAGEESLQTSNNLYKKLLHPVDSSINKSKKVKKIVIIPDDVLNYLNFELLTKPGQKDRHYALFDYEFSYGYSSTLLWAEFSEQLKWDASTFNMVGFAPEFIAQNKTTGEVSREGSENSNYDSFDFSPLNKNQEEVQLVSEILKHKKAKTSLYLGSKADESSFKKTDLTNVNIIHLATHGFVSNNQKGVAGIAFAKKDGSTDDGILYMDEIFSLRNRANLVCLSACETGGGILNNGEGLLGLTRAFIYSGSQNLVVSLWKVQDESTAQLMTSFYSNLVKKQSISASLRSAKLEMIKKNPTVHPYYWSAFIHIGLN